MVKAREIFRLFDIGSQADNDGYIRISSGQTNQRGRDCQYLFHPEEIFLFLMTRCKKGWTIKDMCNQVFGGDYTRWCYGWKWILFYLDHRYRNILGHQGLMKCRERFPEFFEAIQQRVCQSKRHQDENGNWWESPGLAFLPYRIFYSLIALYTG